MKFLHAIQTSTINVRIDFPALDKLVTYLQANQQAQVDALSTSVGDLANRLKTSSDNLRVVMNKEQNP